MYYITYVLGMAGLSGNANLVASSINYVIKVLVTVPALLFLDRVGRRPLLVCGGLSLMTW
jgi:Na+/melibiose symporter-like transporter